MEEKHEFLNSQKNEKALLIAIILNLIISLTEIIGGIWSGSLALLSDALHNLGDTTSLFISLFSLRLSLKEETPQRTYGYRRAEVLGAFVNSLLIFATLGYIFIEAIQRLFSPQVVEANIILGIAIVGLSGNLFSVFFLFPGSRESLNLRSSFWHLLADTFSSLVVIIGALFIKYRGWFFIDPLFSIGLSLLLLRGSWKMFKEVVNILMQGAPPHLNLESLKKGLEALPGVKNIHHLHVWSLNDKEHFAEFHVTTTCSSWEEIDQLREKIQKTLFEDFQIEHSTIQFENKGCKNQDLIVKEK
ncbi:MAG TPA: cation diffusion facilitator family transporter [Candidatus Atribacteria bacterium]|nr:cation diffusion facilitator family transporter [Candidatus Atribacteria bacterium]